MVTGYPSALYDTLLDHWHRLERPHFARSNGVRKNTEVLWLNH
ncbi:hypothetical protein FACS189497_00510 [Betaproteobacteria bacterium]|nr:hypothetical protein FACS189488_10210 [Betaproteobacteria bacterium]GHU27402.1 hypothetical protein FACS189497_00510 [Betaproteobacteria bacterium]